MLKRKATCSIILNVVKYNGIYYYVYREYPSGYLDDRNTFAVTGEYNPDTDKTTLTIEEYNYVPIKNKVTIDGVKYDYNETIEATGNVIGKTISIFAATFYGNSTNDFNQGFKDFLQYGDITIKGNVYKQYDIIIN